MLLYVHTETVHGEPRKSTSTFTQLLSSEDTVLDECCFMSTETICLLGTGAQDGHLDFHIAPEDTV